MFDALNITLDKAIARADADIRNIPINICRREKANNLFEDGMRAGSGKLSVGSRFCKRTRPYKYYGYLNGTDITQKTKNITFYLIQNQCF